MESFERFLLQIPAYQSVSTDLKYTNMDSRTTDGPPPSSILSPWSLVQGPLIGEVTAASDGHIDSPKANGNR